MTTEETYLQVRNFLMLKGQLVRYFVPLMSDKALILASEILVAEGKRRQEERDATQEGPQP